MESKSLLSELRQWGIEALDLRVANKQWLETRLLLWNGLCDASEKLYGSQDLTMFRHDIYSFKHVVDLAGRAGEKGAVLKSYLAQLPGIENLSSAAGNLDGLMLTMEFHGANAMDIMNAIPHEIVRIIEKRHLALSKNGPGIPSPSLIISSQYGLLASLLEKLALMEMDSSEEIERKRKRI